MTKSQLVWGFVVALFVLRHDWWNWSDGSLWFGFLPIGLGYQALIAISAGLVFGLVIKFAWPARLEQWANDGDQTDDAGPPLTR